MYKKSIFFLLFSLLINACISKTYSENDVTFDEKAGIYFDKQNKRPINGLLIEHDEDKTIKTKIKHGKEHGSSKTFLKNSRPSCDRLYKNGSLDGISKCFYDDGNLSFEINYKNGEHHGSWKEYYQNGGLMSETYYKDGKIEGVSKEYYSNGNLKAEISYKNDELNGSWKNYYENGKLEKVSEYKMGIPHGFWKNYYENGKLKSDRLFKDGKVDQKWDFSYYETGEISQNGSKNFYKNGKLRSDHYAKSNTYIIESYYESGKINNREIFYNPKISTDGHSFTSDGSEIFGFLEEGYLCFHLKYKKDIKPYYAVNGLGKQLTHGEIYNIENGKPVKCF